MALEVPERVKLQVELFLDGNPLQPPKSPEPPSREELFAKALGIFEFLDELAHTEPVRTLLGRMSFSVLQNFRPGDSRTPQSYWGSLVLAVVAGKPGLYFWLDKTCPHDHRHSECVLVCKEDLPSWHTESLGQLARVTEEWVWQALEELATSKRVALWHGGEHRRSAEMG